MKYDEHILLSYIPPSTTSMRFRSKRDNVKALQCTLKELQGIDPLDYLAKYCIIDQEKLPHYRRVYDNVDRDEDDEIDTPELDFALKAVNYDLISDAEMSYVHSVSWSLVSFPGLKSLFPFGPWKCN